MTFQKSPSYIHSILKDQTNLLEMMVEDSKQKPSVKVNMRGHELLKLLDSMQAQVTERDSIMRSKGLNRDLLRKQPTNDFVKYEHLKNDQPVSREGYRGRTVEPQRYRESRDRSVEGYKIKDDDKRKEFNAKSKAMMDHQTFEPFRDRGYIEIIDNYQNGSDIKGLKRKTRGNESQLDRQKEMMMKSFEKREGPRFSSSIDNLRNNEEQLPMIVKYGGLKKHPEKNLRYEPIEEKLNEGEGSKNEIQDHLDRDK